MTLSVNSSLAPAGAVRRRAWQWGDLAGLLLIAGAVLLAASTLAQPGIQNGGDMLMSIYRVFELERAWQRGVLYPRLGPDLNFGLGVPLFQFYPPLASYTALLFAKLSFTYIDATKIVMALSLLASGLGVYIYLRWLTGRTLGAAAAGVTFVFSHYWLLVLYDRGAAAEGLALAVLPWLVWTTHRLLYERRFRSVAAAGSCVALVMLAHNITALFVIPSVLLYGVILALRGRTEHERLGALPAIAGAFALGFGLSAFYWLPALAELRYSRAESLMLGALTDVTTWLVPPTALVQSTPAVNLAGDERFRFGLLMFLFGAAGVLTLPLQNRAWRFNAALLAAAWIVILLLQTEPARLFWTQLPLVRFLQFPWRLYGLATLCIVLVLGMLLNSDRLARPFPILPPALAAVIVGASLVGGLANLRRDALPLWTPMRPTKVGLADLFGHGSHHFPLFVDYTPAAMRIYGSGISSPRLPQDQEPVAVDPAPAIVIDRLVRNGFELSVSSPAPFPLKAPRTYFPGWQIYVDGAPAPTTPSGPLGLAAATIPAGDHKVRIAFDQTPLRTAADWISLLSLAGMVGGIIAAAPLRRKPLWLAGAGVAGLGIFLVVQAFPTLAAVTPVPYNANLGDEVQLLAYQVDAPVAAPGEKLGVKLYWYVQKTPTEDRKVFLHLNLPDDSGRVAQNDQSPLLNFYPTSQWEGGQIFADEYQVEIPADAPPGRYVLTAGMYRPDPLQNLPVLSGPNTWPGDRMVLTEVEIAHDR